jgi:hypothetical protein
MSLSETQEIMQVLQEIIQLLDGVEVKTNKAIDDFPKMKESLTTLREVERVALRYLALTRRMGLSDGAQQQIQTLSEIIVTVRMLQTSLNLLMSGTPLGTLMSIAGFAMTGFAIYDSMEGYQ